MSMKQADKSAVLHKDLIAKGTVMINYKTSLQQRGYKLLLLILWVSSVQSCLTGDAEPSTQGSQQQHLIFALAIPLSGKRRNLIVRHLY